MMRRVWAAMPWVIVWRQWRRYWLPALKGDPQTSSDRITDRTDR